MIRRSSFFVAKLLSTPALPYSSTLVLSVALTGLGGCVHYASLPPLTQNAATSGSILITQARVFDGGAASPILDNTDLLIEDGRITRIAPHPMKADAETVLDAQGKLVMPGLIDMHVHVNGTEAPPWRPTFYPPERTLSAFLAFGVTSVVDMGGIPKLIKGLQDDIEQKETSGPRLAFAGRQISVAHSHPGPLIETSLAWPVGKLIKNLMVDEISDTTDFEALIKSRKDDGASVVKIMIDQIPLESPSLPAPLAQKTVEAAHRQGLPVAAHVGSEENLLTALDAGVDYIAHSVNRTPLSSAALDRLQAANTPVISTLRVFQNVGTAIRGDNPVTADDTRVMDSGVVESFKTPGETEPTMRHYAENIAKHTKDMFDGCRALQARGMPMLLGTDSPLFGAPAGSSTHHELALLVNECGFTPQQALSMATSRPGAVVGEWLHLPGLGTLSEGAPADLLLIDGDPTQNIAHSIQISRIIARGRLIDSHLPPRP